MEKINKLKRNQLKNLAKTKKPLNFQHAVNRLDLKKKITVTCDATLSMNQ